MYYIQSKPSVANISSYRSLPIRLTESLDLEYMYIRGVENLTNECNEKKDSMLYCLISPIMFVVGDLSMIVITM